MKRAVILFLVAFAPLLAAESPFPYTPASEDKPAPDSVAGQKLGFLVLDYRHPGVYGRSTNFWIAGSGQVHTQAFNRRKDGKQDETRYEYELDPDQLTRLRELLEVLRQDGRVLRERYGSAGESAPILAFTLPPRADLYVREKWRADHWPNLTAATRFLSDLHRAKAAEVKPSYTGKWDLGEEIWEPEGFPSLEVINSFGYIGSETYNAMLDESDKPEQDGADPPDTAPQSKAQDKRKPEPESEDRAR